MPPVGLSRGVYDSDNHRLVVRHYEEDSLFESFDEVLSDFQSLNPILHR